MSHDNEQKSFQEGLTARKPKQPAKHNEWSGQFIWLLDKEDGLNKWEEIRALSKDFVTVAEAYGRIIISEYFVSPKDQSIQPTKTVTSGGRIYICQEILFKFALDILMTGGFLYGGKTGRNDEKAMKSACNERKGSQCYFDCRIPGLYTALLCLIHYRGFCLVAQSKLPVGRDTLKYGKDVSESVVRQDNGLINRMELAGYKLNLASQVGGKSIGSGGIEGHVGYDGAYYVLHFKRVMPPEYPFHGNMASIGYNLLRPELVRKFDVALCSDAFSRWLEPSQANKLKSEVHLASLRLDELVIQLAENLTNEKTIKKTPELLIFEDHRNGINIRHLGRVRERIRSIKGRSQHENFNLILTECVARTVKNMFRLKMREKMEELKISTEDPYRQEASKFLGEVLNFSNELSSGLVKAQDSVLAILRNQVVGKQTYCPSVHRETRFLDGVTGLTLPMVPIPKDLYPQDPGSYKPAPTKGSVQEYESAKDRLCYRCNLKNRIPKWFCRLCCYRLCDECIDYTEIDTEHDIRQYKKYRSFVWAEQCIYLNQDTSDYFEFSLVQGNNIKFGFVTKDPDSNGDLRGFLLNLKGNYYGPFDCYFPSIFPDTVFDEMHKNAVIPVGVTVGLLWNKTTAFIIVSGELWGKFPLRQIFEQEIQRDIAVVPLFKLGRDTKITVHYSFPYRKERVAACKILEGICKKEGVQLPEVLFSKRPNESFWKEVIKKEIESRYPGCLTEQEKDSKFDLRKNVEMVVMIDRLQILSGIELSGRVTDAWKLKKGLTFVEFDIKALKSRVSYMSILDYAEAVSIYLNLSDVTNLEKDAQLQLMNQAKKSIENAANQPIPVADTYWYWGLILAKLARLEIDLERRISYLEEALGKWTICEKLEAEAETEAARLCSKEQFKRRIHPANILYEQAKALGDLAFLKDSGYTQVREKIKAFVSKASSEDKSRFEKDIIELVYRIDDQSSANVPIYEYRKLKHHVQAALEVEQLGTAVLDEVELVTTRLYCSLIVGFPLFPGKYRKDVDFKTDFFAEIKGDILALWKKRGNKAIDRSYIPRQLAEEFEIPDKICSRESFSGSGVECSYLAEILHEFHVKSCKNHADIWQANKVYQALTQMNPFTYEIGELDLSGYRISKFEARSLSRHLAITDFIQVLKLSSCHIGDESGKMIIDSLTRNTSLEKLDLSCNKLAKYSLLALVTCFSSNSSLHNLVLRDNRLGVHGEKVAFFMSKATTLEKLDLANNGLLDNAGIKIARALSDREIVRQCDLFKPNGELERLPEGRPPGNTTLKRLNLEGNSFHSADVHILDATYDRKYLELLMPMNLCINNQEVDMYLKEKRYFGIHGSVKEMCFDMKLCRYNLSNMTLFGYF
eukprot:TRINITY_DN13589_c0_g1_i3.p1 TRINITY_DN13589_c0_g1~~TRINITY_DN13589_c0_g1_i3.p1  ORF type:complete len:1364 (-),score=219.05 TRINITY_DN13589_c0_g1_i3:886-4977(-)